MLLVNVDPHSPARWRVNGPLANMPEFQAAFKCQAGDPMVAPEEARARIW
jgi:predicted metalloendopeptidase